MIQFLDKILKRKANIHFNKNVKLQNSLTELSLFITLASKTYYLNL